jgi:hypothetical protein
MHCVQQVMTLWALDLHVDLFPGIFWVGIVGVFSPHRHPLPPYMAMTSHARYLLGTPAPSSAQHGGDFYYNLLLPTRLRPPRWIST